jgi:hypothetical protein
MSKFDPVDDFIAVFDAFNKATGFGDHRNSRLILFAGHRIGDIRAGGDIGGRILKEAMQRLSDNWPRDKSHLWPRNVPRPPITKPKNQTELVAAR